MKRMWPVLKELEKEGLYNAIKENKMLNKKKNNLRSKLRIRRKKKQTIRFYFS